MLAAPKEALSTNVKQDGKSIDKKGGGGLRTHITHSLLRSEQCTMASTRPKGRREGAFLKTNFKFGLEVALEKKNTITPNYSLQHRSKSSGACFVSSRGIS